MIFRSLQSVRRIREAWKRERYVWSQSLLSELAFNYIPTSGEEGIPSPGRSRSVKCPTQGQHQLLADDVTALAAFFILS